MGINSVKTKESVIITSVEALAGMHLYAQAIKLLEHVFTSKHLPGLSFNKLKENSMILPKFGNFDNSKKLTEASNIKVVKELCAASLTAQQVDAYGIKTARMVEVAQAHLLNCIAGTVNAVPDDMTVPR
eukprot:gene6317-7040_t